MVNRYLSAYGLIPPLDPVNHLRFVDLLIEDADELTSGVDMIVGPLYDGGLSLPQCVQLG